MVDTSLLRYESNITCHKMHIMSQRSCWELWYCDVAFSNVQNKENGTKHTWLRIIRCVSPAWRSDVI